MPSQIKFETPENVQITYDSAGLGTRFVAWVIDTILLSIMMFVILIVLLFAGASVNVVVKDFFEPFEDLQPGEQLDIPLYIIGLMMLVFGLGSFFYFGFSELLFRGQTIGKRQVKIRVVKVDGFSLDPLSIFVRSIFRVVDHIPPFWIVPLVSARAQRLGDMIAGTVVVSDRPDQMDSVREFLSQRSPAESKFHFSSTALNRARGEDIEAVEKILDRWHGISKKEKELLLSQLVEPLTRRLKVEPPELHERLRFLEDFLAAEYQRQYRKLG